jgi:hypothetical protein
MNSTTAGGVRPSIGSPAATRRRISDDETSRRGIVTWSNRHPGPGGSACSPARSTTAIAARSRVSSSLRHRVGTEQQEQFAIRRLKPFERVGSHRRSLVVQLDARHLDPFESEARPLHHLEPLLCVRDDLTPFLPGITGGHHQHPIEPESRPHVDRGDDVAHVDRVEGATQDPHSFGHIRSIRSGPGGPALFTSP